MQLSQRVLSVLMAKKAVGDITFIASSATYNSAAVSYPSGVASGVLAVFIDLAADQVSVPSAVTPSGYTLLSNVLDSSGTEGRFVVCYRVLNGSESGSVTGMYDPSVDVAKSLLLFSTGGRTVTGANGAAVEGSGSTATVNTTTGTSAQAIIVGQGLTADPGGIYIAAGQLTTIHSSANQKVVYGINKTGQTHAIEATASNFACGAGCATINFTT